MKAASPHALLRAQFLRFAVVGAAGFIVDEGVLALLHYAAGLPATPARAVSILSAMVFTWWGNRTLTFHDFAAKGARAMAAEFARFVAANSIGALINYATFLLMIDFAPSPLGDPFIATAIGVGAGMLFNFFSSRTMVFAAKPALAAVDATFPPSSPGLSGRPNFPRAGESEMAPPQARGVTEEWE